MKKDNLIYWISTGLLCAIMLFSAAMYIFNHEMAKEAYIGLGYPTYLIYFSATAKILGVTAILTKKSTLLKNMAYAGFFYMLILALLAHFMAGDSQYAFALVGFIALIFSYKYDRKLFK